MHKRWTALFQIPRSSIEQIVGEGVVLERSNTSFRPAAAGLPPAAILKLCRQARPMMPPCVWELGEMYELVEEILIRIPPDKPTVLVRASLVCKAWCRLLSGYAFRSHYRTLHKTPPILGFLESWAGYYVKRFIPTTKFCPRSPKRQDCYVLDCRHGRVLLACENVDEEDYNEEKGEGEEEEEDMEEEERKISWMMEVEERKISWMMVVWDPVLGSRMELHYPDILDPDGPKHSATVLCEADGCNHTPCNSGPFRVALICSDDDDYGKKYTSLEDKRYVRASVYSSETHEWTSPIQIRVGRLGNLGAHIIRTPSVLVGEVVYVLFDHGLVPHGTDSVYYAVLKYDVGRSCLSVADLPELCVSKPLLISTVTDNGGGVGLVHVDQHELCLIWSMEVSPDGAVSWTQLREMNLKMLLPVCNPRKLHSSNLVGFVEGTDIIIVATDLGVFTIDLKSLRLKELSSKKYTCSYEWLRLENIFFYMSFYSSPLLAGVVDNARAIEAGRGDAAL